MSQAYSDPRREGDAYSLPDLEVFWLDENNDLESENSDEPYAKGWYYWYCMPGCLPNGNPIGPYDSEAEALKAAREENDTTVEDPDSLEHEPKSEPDPRQTDLIQRH